MSTKTCTKCGVDHPATLEFFPPRKHDSKDGFSSWCRVCRKVDGRAIMQKRRATAEGREQCRAADRRYSRTHPDRMKVYQ